MSRYYQSAHLASLAHVERHNRRVTADARALLVPARRITVLTGAGVSTDSGIPDYRGPNGLWTREPGAQRFVDLDLYRHDEALRRESWRRRAVHPAFTAVPNAAHRALASLHQQGRLRALLTQNVDGLHQRAGVPDDHVVQLHGSIGQTECLGCGERRPMADALARVRAGDDDPRCARCGGILKSATVFFGQPLDMQILGRAVEAACDCDLFLAVGTSLSVQPVASLVGMAARDGIPVVIVNNTATPYDGVAAALVRDPIGETLPRLLALGDVTASDS
jgi:NAD-dependent deacetylase